MLATATLSSKYQRSIPKTVREEQHWEAGHEFVFIPKGKGVLVMPLDTNIALRAADLHCQFNLATADAIVYATTSEYDAELLTCDAHFAKLSNVILYRKSA